MRSSIKSSLLCFLLFQLALLPAWSQGSEQWLRILNAQSGRDKPLTEKDVLFCPAESGELSSLVAVGYLQSDGSHVLGSILWQGKAWAPLAGYAQVLKSLDFANKDDEERKQIFWTLLSAANLGLGIHPYDGEKSREIHRPQPISSRSSSNGTHQFKVWFYEEAGAREGPEWREVIYFVSADGEQVKARTLQTFHPLVEGLVDFPSTRK